MDSTDPQFSGALAGRWIAADYARFVGLRTVPGGLFLLGFTLIGPRVGHLLPVLVQAILTYGAAVVALLVTAEIGLRYRRAYGSVSAKSPPRVYRFAFSIVLVGGLALLFQRFSSLPAWPYWFMGATLIFWSLPFEGGGFQRVRWHWVVAGVGVAAIGQLDIHKAIPLLALLTVLVGVADHLIFVRRFPRAGAEPTGT